MTIRVAVRTTASPEQVWRRLVDVARWPSWTKSMTSVQRLDAGPLWVGSRARIKQPGMPASVWEVTSFDEGREFTWQARVPGVRTVARHRLVPHPEGGSDILLELEQHGPLAGLVSALTKRRARRYVEMEARGLKAAAEAGA